MNRATFTNGNASRRKIQNGGKVQISGSVYAFIDAYVHNEGIVILIKEVMLISNKTAAILSVHPYSHVIDSNVDFPVVLRS